MSTITPLPTPPQRSDPANFPARADAFMTALPTFATETNVVAGEVNTNAGTASTAATTATTQAGIATTQAGLATSAAQSAMNAPGTSATSTTSLTIGTGTKAFTIQTGKAFSPGQQVVIARTSAPSNRMFARLDSYDSGTGAVSTTVTTSEGSGTFTDWTMSLGVAASSAPAPLIIDSRSSNTALTQGDLGKLILASGTFTQTLNAVATLGLGWNLEYENAGNGNITIDPNGSELIDGQTTYVLVPGVRIRLQSDGTKITVSVIRPRRYGNPVLVTATGTYIVPADTYVLRVYAFGRGGNGTVGPQTGGGGGCAYGDIAVTPGQTVNFDITSGVAKVTVAAVDMLTANSASGGTAGTASKHASVTNGGNFSGGAGMASAGGGASSGSPLGVGVSSATGQNGGCGWGGAGANNNGGGTGGAAPGVGNIGGPAISSIFKSTEPLLALLDGIGGVLGGPGAQNHAGHGGHGAGGGGANGASAVAGNGGFGAGGGGNPSGQGGNGGFGAGGSRGGTASTGGNPGYGGGAPDGGSIVGGAAAIIYFPGV